MKRLIQLLILTLAIVLMFTSAYAGKLSVFEKNAVSGRLDKGALTAFSQYGESVEAEAQQDQTIFKIEDIVRDGMQTKISFIVSNIEIDEFYPVFELKDDFENIYKGKFINMQHDETQKCITGVMEFEPVTDSRVSSLELFVQDKENNFQWNVKFNVDPKKVGPEAKKYIVKKATEVDKKTVELVEIVSTPSVAKVYLNSEAGLWYGEIKDTKGKIVSEIMQGFAPLEKQDNWTHEWTFNPIPENVDLVLEVHTKAGQTLEIPFKL